MCSTCDSGLRARESVESERKVRSVPQPRFYKLARKGSTSLQALLLIDPGLSEDRIMPMLQHANTRCASGRPKSKCCQKAENEKRKPVRSESAQSGELETLRFLAPGVCEKNAPPAKPWSGYSSELQHGMFHSRPPPLNVNVAIFFDGSSEM